MDKQFGIAGLDTGDKCVLGRKILLEAKGQGALQKTNFRVDN